jgi:hypothetical protein
VCGRARAVKLPRTSDGLRRLGLKKITAAAKAGRTRRPKRRSHTGEGEIEIDGHDLSWLHDGDLIATEV